jgi:glycosyltransferase involved in cell wall biosynthesis
MLPMSEAGGDRAPAAASPPSRAAGARVAALGLSTGVACGVHDHAALLADALARERVSCSLHWLWRTSAPLGAERAQVKAWTAGLRGELEQQRPDALLLHYSVFAFSHRGLPLYVHPVLSAVRELRVPVVSVLHEYAYPWRLGGLRGKVWAASQRALLLELVRASAALVVTADFRAQWLRGRVWLPRRPTAVASVFSNLPVVVAPASAPHSPPVVGLFGYAHEGIAAELVLDALRLLERRGTDAQLTLLGAPGRSSAAADAWLRAARARAVREPAFSGVLSAQELADALAACDVLLCADRIGPTPRKTTLAASLASGRPVIALDGRRTWSELREREAALIAPPAAGALADALAGLLHDEPARERLGARGREFAARAMSVEHSARVVAGLLEQVIGARA